MNTEEKLEQVTWEESFSELREAIAQMGLRSTEIDKLVRWIRVLGPEELGAFLTNATGVSACDAELPRMELSDLLLPELVQGDLFASSWPPVVSEAIRLLKRSRDPVDTRAALGNLLEVGMTPEWFPGGGFGIPSIEVEGLALPRVVVIRLRVPIKIPATGEEVRLLFFLFGGFQSNENRVQLQSRIARLMADPSNRGLLQVTTDSWALYQTLKTLDA